MDIKDISSAIGLANNKMYGRVGFRLKDKNGNVVDEGKSTNNIVIGIRNPIIKLLGGWNVSDPTTLPFIRQLALGGGNTPPTVLDERLEAEILGSRKTLATTPTISEDGLSLTVSFLYDVLDDSVDNKDIKEMGLYTSDNTMVARTVVGLWRKTPGLYFEIYWTIGYAPQE